ncbi:MAG TPA: hypothetical protein VMT55_06215 [Candidatus Sulfotelmatobacter sp.]|nr:hypothetical protein [Candidatus Sulfotelmatobacter sp.]
MKKGTVPPDYGRLYQKIEAGLAPKKAGWPVRPLLSLALVAMLLLLALPFIKNINAPGHDNNEFVSYIFQNEPGPGPDVVNYIFED